ncbi:phage holin family protein [Luteimonas marina]|uniref:Phage holin family protein n=1 Tax=Luteimonas marina TaxID=488485 RepID=A0A5C5TXW5_9GAMM|nr:phage holin family protein [Luteimonas marina]TWT19061.1 phage holin family protein [Luteimonas marina]
MTGETASDSAQAREAAGAQESPGIDDAVRAIGAEGRATLDSALDAGRALRRLVSADLALARSALGRALAWTAVAIIFGASAWLISMGALIALLQATGLSWLASLSIAALLSLAVMGVAIWRVSVFFDHAGMHATRRQLSKLGLFSEDDDEDGAGDAPAREQVPP